MLLLTVLDVRVDEEGVYLAVDVLDGYLEAVEAAGLLCSRGGGGAREGGKEGEVGVRQRRRRQHRKREGGGVMTQSNDRSVARTGS